MGAKITRDTRISLLSALFGLALLPACGDAVIESNSTDGSESGTGGDGDGDGSDSDSAETGSDSNTTMGDGDGDPAGDGDGDGDTAGDGDGDTAGDGDGDTAGDGDGDTAGDGDGDTAGDGDGDTSGDGDGDNTGDGDGEPNDNCGDGIVQEGEDCDDQNLDNEDGCLTNCTVPRTCLDILAADPESPSGAYIISPKPDTPWMTQCDMSTDGGGWTQIRAEHTCNGNLDSEIVEVDDAQNFDVVDCIPETRDLGGGHTYYWDISFPPSFSEFYLDQFTIEANAGGIADSEINGNEFVQGSWGDANGNDHGDVSFGAPDNEPPATSFAAAGANFSCENCQQEFPANLDLFELPGPSTELRIGWGETGIEAEGWRIWINGSIWLR